MPDAKIQAAFAAFAGQRHSAEDAGHIQTAHDHLVAAGASCSGSSASGDAQMGARHSKTDQPALDSAHDLLAEQGASCEPASAQMGVRHSTTNDPAKSVSATAKEKRMTLKEKVMALFGTSDPKALEKAGITGEDLKTDVQFGTSATQKFIKIAANLMNQLEDPLANFRSGCDAADDPFVVAPSGSDSFRMQAWSPLYRSVHDIAQ